MKILDATNLDDLSPEDILIACNGLNTLANLGLSPIPPEESEDLINVALSHIRNIVAICSNFPRDTGPSDALARRMALVVSDLDRLERALREELHEQI